MLKAHAIVLSEYILDLEGLGPRMLARKEELKAQS